MGTPPPLLGALNTQVIVYKCLHDMAPPYLSELCRQTRNIERRRQLRSATRGDLDVPIVDYLHAADGPFSALAQHGTLYLLV